MLIRKIAEKAAKITDLTESVELELRPFNDRDELVVGTLSDDAKRLYILDAQLFKEAGEIDKRLAGMSEGKEKEELRKQRRFLVMECNFIRTNIDAWTQYEVPYEYEKCRMGIREGWRIVVPKDPKQRLPAAPLMIDLSKFTQFGKN